MSDGHAHRRADIVHFDFYFDDWLSGTFELNLELRGALITISALMGKTGLRLRDDPAIMARWMGCSIRKWTAIRQALLEAGKITIEDGFIQQRRAAAEVKTARKRRENHAESGAKGGQKSAEKRANSLEGNDPEPSHASGDRPTIQNLNQNKTKKVREDGGKPPAADPREIVFQGDVVRLNRRDFERWKATYTTIRDLRAFLESEDAWLRSLEASDRRRQQSFMYLSGKLRKVHEAHLKAEAERPKPEPKSRMVITREKSGKELMREYFAELNCDWADPELAAAGAVH
jgi:uncharacterized protein YdaU (DUF1376 family)